MAHRLPTKMPATLAALALAGAAGLLASPMGAADRAGTAEKTPRTHIVIVESFAFQPKVVTAAPGDTIIWINRDIVPHTATSDSGKWDSGELRTSARWRVRVTARMAGTYHCAFHPSMKGTVQLRRSGR